MVKTKLVRLWTDKICLLSFSRATYACFLFVVKKINAQYRECIVMDWNSNSSNNMEAVVISETHLKLKSREISLGHNLLFMCQIVLKFRTYHCSFVAGFCTNYQNDLTTETDVLDERDFARFEFMMSFGRITDTETAPWFPFQWSARTWSYIP